MKVSYTFNKNCYLLTNFATSNNPIFLTRAEVNNFISRLDEGLSALCEILAYHFTNHEYQLVVVLKERAAFEAFYAEKMKKQNREVEFIPESTYILSQQMANIQSGYVKWFNFKYGRFGGMFGRRYTKILIQNEEELNAWVDRLEKGTKFWIFGPLWSFRKNFPRAGQKRFKLSINSSEAESDSGKRSVFRSFLTVSNFLLRGRYISTHNFSKNQFHPPLPKPPPPNSLPFT